MADELVDHIHPNGRIVGPVSKHAAHRHGWLHRIVLADVRTPDGRLVLVRQTPDRQDAGQFVHPVGGHIMSGESDLDALHRETHEEIGITGFSAAPVGNLIYERHVIGRHENHWFNIFQIVVDPADIILGDEADEFRVFTVSELKTAQRSTPHLFGVSYTYILERLFPELLP